MRKLKEVNIPKKPEGVTWSAHMRIVWGEDKWQRMRLSWIKNVPICRNQSQKIVDVIQKMRDEWDIERTYLRKLARELRGEL